MRKIFLPPELYEGTQNLTKEQKAFLFDYIYKYNLGIEFEIRQDLQLVFGFFKPFFDNDIEIHKKFCESRRQNGLKGGRPHKNWENTQKPTKATKPTKANEVKGSEYIYLINKEDIKKILTEEEINENINQLYIFRKMIDYGHLVKKDKTILLEEIKRISDMAKDYVGRKENGSLDWNTAKIYTNQRYDYASGLPKKQTNIKNGLRNSFNVYSGKRGK